MIDTTTITGCDAAVYSAARIVTPSRVRCGALVPVMVPSTGGLRLEDDATGFARTPAWSPPT